MIKVFIAIESLLYFSFMTGDLFLEAMWFDKVSIVLKLSAIIGCFLFVNAVFIKHNTNDSNQMRMILFFTVCSDFFLLLTRQFEIGVLLFILVQVLYAYRISVGGNWHIKAFVLLGVAFLLTGYHFIKSGGEYGLLVSVGIFYSILFIWNIIDLISAEESRFANKSFFLMGLILYAVCDIHVLVYNFPSYFQNNALLRMWYDFSGIAMWLFYLPGQVLLSLSVVPKTLKIEDKDLK